MIPIAAVKPPSETRIVVAMSGGVDSSVTAALLVEQGFEVVGITLQLYDHGVAVGRAGSCCAGQDIHDARQVADRLGIPHYVLDYEARFRTAVIEDFADAYVRGETPIPCVRCNQRVKFRDLLATALDLGADALATGHYVDRRIEDEGPVLYRATDPSRDQSYFLFATRQEDLARLRFPLGRLRKEETRAIARRHCLAVATKADSQDICFVPKGRYVDVLARIRPEAMIAGEIVDTAGRILGRHDGIAGFTVGQRRGLGVSSAEPLYVIRLEPETARVVVGRREDLARRRFRLSAVNWLGAEGRPASAGDGERIEVKVRSMMPPVPASLYREPPRVPLGAPLSAAEVVLDVPHIGIAPGQACVFYRGDRLMGGGWICRD